MEEKTFGVSGISPSNSLPPSQGKSPSSHLIIDLHKLSINFEKIKKYSIDRVLLALKESGFSLVDGLNFGESLKQFLMNANQNEANVQFVFGEVYFYGLGVDVDYHMAMKWYLKASEK